ncbi:MAG: GNAT family N-acetyltransferase [Candidatus Lokiarchaeota archaeon]|nr:GNAT family N-acetyltransferase [Candidatus Lokiarchaeota archaeon]MBD3199615.1 GNAT family N-acetyltransferase [Candidatus Lokiarchaeota archaeon]
MKIEQLSIKEYEEVLNLWKKTELSVGSSDTKKQVKRMIERNPNLCLVGKLNVKTVAVVLGAFDGRRGYVHHLAVDPDYQRKRYGSMLMAELMKRFKKIKVHKVHLFIEKRNQDVIKFYKEIGWTFRDDLVMMSYVPDKELYKMRI